MALVNVTDINNKVVTIESSKVSRVVDLSTSRKIWFGPGDTATSPTYFISVKETIDVLASKLGLVKLLTSSNYYCIVNPAFVSFVNPVGTTCTLMIGACDIPSTSGTTLIISEKIDALVSKLGLLKAISNASNLSIGINRNYISRIIDGGNVRTIWFGVSDIKSVSTTNVLVKDDILALQKLTGFVKVNTTADRPAAINLAYVASVQDLGSYRKIWMGVGNIAGVKASSVSVKETRSELTVLGVF